MDKIESFSFHQTGGFMGMDRSYNVKLSEMNSSERQELEHHIKESGIFDNRGGEWVTKGAADMFSYTFTVSDGNETREVTFDDGTLPESYRAIVEFARDKMVDNRRR